MLFLLFIYFIVLFMLVSCQVWTLDMISVHYGEKGMLGVRLYHTLIFVMGRNVGICLWWSNFE